MIYQINIRSNSYSVQASQKQGLGIDPCSQSLDMFYIALQIVLYRSPLDISYTPASTMPSLIASSNAAIRTCARIPSPLYRMGSIAVQKRFQSQATFESPYDSTKVPSFAKYRSKGGEDKMKLYQYFMVGTFGALTAFGAKATVQG